jgi:hypothetical protein
LLTVCRATECCHAAGISSRAVVDGVPADWMLPCRWDQFAGRCWRCAGRLNAAMPQWSVRGPLLFRTFVNDFYSVVVYSNCLLFAPWTQNFISRQSVTSGG